MPKVVGYKADNGNEDHVVSVGGEERKVKSDGLAKLKA